MSDDLEPKELLDKMVSKFEETVEEKSLVLISEGYPLPISSPNSFSISSTSSSLLTLARIDAADTTG